MHDGRRSARRTLSLGAAALVLVLAAWPATTIARSAPNDVPASAAAFGSPDVAEVRPSIQYEEAQAHAGDTIEFAPGERVSVGFTPRADDRWAVGGAPPEALPAGQATGREMRTARQGSVWTVAPPPGLRRGRDGAGAGADTPIDGAISPSIRAMVASSRSTGPLETGSAPGAVISPSGLRREVFGFLPYWALSDSSTTYRWDVLSTIAYFSVGTDRSGNLIKQDAGGSASTGWDGWTSSKMTSVITAAHQNGTRVVLTISCFAWTSGQQAVQADLLGSSTARANLASQVAAAVRDRGADGVNLDFEPIVSGYADGFTALVQAVRAELDAVAPGYQLTFDTTGSIGNYPIEAATAPGGADAVFIMGYDYRGSSSSTAGSISPLSGPRYDLTDTVNAYVARVSPSKLILGVPYYGRAWSTDSDAPNARSISGTQYGRSVTATYQTAVGLGAQYGRRFDSVEQSPWTAYQRETCTTTYGCVTAWRELYYDDAESLKLRYDLVNRAGLRGAGIWALGYDGTRPELYQALTDKFVLDTTPPRVGVDALPTVQRDLAFEVRWSGVDESSMASYDIQFAADGGAWMDWRIGTVATRDIFMGAEGHGYAFRARGRDAYGNVSAWDVVSTSTAATLATGGFATVQVDGLQLRAAAATSAAALGTLNAGDVVAITGGPASADGYTWHEVMAPIRQWSPVDAVRVGAWIATSRGAQVYVTPRLPVNATIVSPMLANYRIGRGGSRLVTPNGDGLSDTVWLDWTNAQALDSVALNVLRADGTLMGTRPLAATAGPQAFAWDGSIGRAVVPQGTYILRVVAQSGALAYTAPSATIAMADQLAAFGVTIDPSGVTRLGGASRYETAAAISAATYAPGVPVAYIATGLNFPDALAGAAAAGVTGGPLLLVTADSLPAATAAELARLKPARIVILGATGAVSPAVAAALAAYAVGG